MKGSMESISNYVPGGAKAVSDAYNQANGDGNKAAQIIENASGSRTEFAGEDNGYVEFNIYRFASSTKPATIRIDTDTERRRNINKKNTKTAMNMMIGMR